MLCVCSVCLPRLVAFDCKKSYSPSVNCFKQTHYYKPSLSQVATRSAPECYQYHHKGLIYWTYTYFTHSHGLPYYTVFSA